MESCRHGGRFRTGWKLFHLNSARLVERLAQPKAGILIKVDNSIMGAALSSHNAGHNAEKSVQWLLDYQESAIKYASSVSLEAFDKDGVRYLAVAYHASDSPHVCSPTQHLRFALSKDGMPVPTT